MNKWMITVALAGLVLATYLVVDQGLAEVMDGVGKIGWGILPVLLIHLLQMVLTGLGWFCFFDASGYRGSSAGVILLRWIREGINSLLPTVQIGGEVVSIRLLMLRGMSGGTAGATIVLDLTMEIVSQFLFTLIGLLLLIHGGYAGPVVGWVILGMIISVPVILSFLLAQNHGLFRLLEQLIERSSLLSGNPLEGLHDSIQSLYRRRVALLSSCGLHLLSWLIGAFEVWVILYCIGTPVSLSQALVLESLGQAVRSAVFFIPGGLGVQEASYLLFGMIYGLPPEQGLALSLLKRVREVLLGLPGLLAWQLLEGKRLWERV